MRPCIWCKANARSVKQPKYCYACAVVTMWPRWRWAMARTVVRRRAFVRDTLRDAKLSEIMVVSVNEAGASVYSASDVAREELPDVDLTVAWSRSASPAVCKIHWLSW